jgi:2'-5' RNA ligase
LPLTIGVSVAVPEPWATEIQDLRAGYGDPRARAIPTHVTLLPPTELAEEQLVGVDGHLRRAAAGWRPFVMALRGSGTFRPVSPVVYLRVEEGMRECRELEAAVRRGPLAREVEFPYHPHVTVVHGLGEAVMDRAGAELRGYRAEFVVRGFSLHVLGEDGVWRPRFQYRFEEGWSRSSSRP